MVNKIELTKEGAENLEKELRHLIDIDRPAVIEALQAARSQGDLSENADYSAAREEQGKIESEIAKMEDILQHCKIISNKDSTDTVALGKRVKMEINGDIEEYSIVSTIEVDPRAGRISNESPLGAAIIGHTPGDEVRFKTESNFEVVVKILEVNNN